LAACGGQAPAGPAPGPAAPAKPRAAAVADAGVAAAVQPYVYSYNPLGKRDPFRSWANEVPGPRGSDGNPADHMICDEPLCRMDIDELNVVAVISGDANPLAMVEDHSGIGYVVRRNTKMGKQGGKVTQILRDCIVVTSFVQAPDGKAQATRTDMCVKPDLRETPPLNLSTGKVFE
jgi:type IV pilus assembly protein PilP